MSSCANPIMVDFKATPFSDALKEREAIIEKGLSDAAKALEEIRTLKLYKMSYSTFEEYCRQRWGVNRQAINCLIKAKQIRKENGRLNDQNLSDTALGQHIARLPKQKQGKVIKLVTANGHTPTVKEVKKVVDQELGIVPKVIVPKVMLDILRKEFSETGKCPICGR